MKKIFLVFAVFCAARINAQIINGSFQNWATDTAYFAGISTYVAGDTFTFQEPVGWTSTNAVTGAASLGGFFLATPSNIAYVGDTSLQLVTDTLTTIQTPLGSRQLTVPGLILNGVFPESAITQNIVSLSAASISPASVPGAGQAFTQRLDSFTGNYQYAPVFDTITNALDTCVMWATLRKGSTIVANAIFKSQDSTHGVWASFSVPFVYESCEIPDTLVILLASSVPNFGGILSGHTDLVRGSVLLVDNLGYDTLVGPAVVAPVAEEIIDTVHENSVDSINVLTNASNCTGATLTVTIVTPPANGTASVADSDIVYIPNHGFGGWDSIYYKDTNPSHDTSDAWLKIFVRTDVGISATSEITMQVFPVPTSDELNIRFTNPGKTIAAVYDMIGNLITTSTLTGDNNIIHVGNLANGLYCLQLVDESNVVISRAKFTVTK